MGEQLECELREADIPVQNRETNRPSEASSITMFRYCGRPQVVRQYDLDLVVVLPLVVKSPVW